MGKKKSKAETLAHYQKVLRDAKEMSARQGWEYGKKAPVFGHGNKYSKNSGCLPLVIGFLGTSSIVIQVLNYFI